MLNTTEVLPPGATGTYLKSDMIEGIILERQLGAGATSHVFLAREAEDAGKLYAVKILNTILLSQEAARKRWEREVDILIRLKHPNIVRGYRHGIVDNRPYLVMEFLQGETLMDRLHRMGSLEEDEVFGVARAALKALGAANEINVIHRDVKPSNMIRLADGTVKLTDFGLARIMGQTDLTATGLIVGTPLYISPEQAAGEEGVTIRADLYSLGNTLYHLVTGRPPFTELNTSLLLTKKITEEVPDPRLVADHVSGEMAYLIKALSERDPFARPSTPEEALDLMERLQSGELTTTGFVPKARSARAPMRPVPYDKIPAGNEVLETIVSEQDLDTHPTFLQPGEVLFYEDDDSRECYILLSGKVEVVKSARGIAVIEEPGSFIGEMSPLNDVPRSATVIAREETVLLRITGEDFTDFFSSRPDMALALARSLALRLQKTSNKLNEANGRLGVVGRHIKDIMGVIGEK